MKDKEKGKYQSYCKSCQSIYRKEHYNNNKEKYKEKARIRNEKIRKDLRKYVKEYKEKHPCVNCGITKPIIILDFDHVKGEKKGTIANMVGTACSLETLKKEIEKCDVRCSNCHRIRHYKENDEMNVGF